MSTVHSATQLDGRPPPGGGPGGVGKRRGAWASVFASGGVTISRIWSQGVGLVMMLTAAKLLTPADFGLFALATAATMILNQLVGVGAYEYVIREKARPEAADTAFWINAAISSGLTAIGLTAALWAARGHPGSPLPYMIAVLVPLTLPAGWRSVIESTMVRDARLASVAGANIAVETLAFACGMAALLAGAGVNALLLHKVVWFVGSVPIFTLFGRWRPHFRFDPSIARRMAGFGGGIFGDRVLGYLHAYGVDLILGVMFNPAAVAIYRVGARIVISLSSVVTEQFRMIAWVRLTHTRAAGGPVAVEAERIVGAALILVWGPFVGLAMTSDLLIAALLGPQWAASGTVISFLALSIVFGVPQMFSDSVFGSLGATRWLVAIRAVTVSLLMLSLLLTARHGPTWTAAGQCVACLLGSLVVMTVQHRVAAVRARAYLGVALRCAVATGTMAIAVAAVKAGLASTGARPIVALAVTAIAGGAVYLGMCWALFGGRLPKIVSSMVVREAL